MCASFKDVEHPCQQCGTTVEDGRPFCPQCRAPQIHVQIAVPDAGVTAGLNPAPDEVSPENAPGAEFSRMGAKPGTTPGTMSGTMPGSMDRGIAVRAALKAGVLGVFIGMIPFLGIVLTGALAVYFYRRESRIVLPPALGARLGGAAGIVVFAVNALFTIPIIVFHAQQECIDSIVKVAQRYGINTAAPEFQTSIHSLFTPQGLASFFIIALALSAVGGALTSVFLRPSNPRL
ncbi:MAG: zinc ribbon domain-containing protein [Terriglobales bacterium]